MGVQHYEQLQARDNYPRTWQNQLFNPFVRPGFCCFSLWCGWCASYSLRKQALYNDMSRYVCCAGACPCSGRFGEQSCPELCLCLEVSLCFAQSVASTRWMIQDELGIANTSCDDCIIGTMIAAQYLACICWCVACITGSQEINDCAQSLDRVADCLWCSVCTCINVQHKVELDARDAGARGGGGGAPAPMQAPQPVQIQMPQQQQQQQAYVAQGYPPQQPQGYPQGYPPQQPQGAYPPQPGGMYR